MFFIVNFKASWLVSCLDEVCAVYINNTLLIIKKRNKHNYLKEL